MSSLSSKEISKSSMDLRSSSTVKQRPKGQNSSKPDWVYADETVTAESPKLKQRHPGKSGSDSEDGGSVARYSVIYRINYAITPFALYILLTEYRFFF